MNEYRLILLYWLRLIPVFIFVTLYMLGGRRYIWIRRWIGGVVFGLLICWIAILDGKFHWIMLGSVVLYPVALSLGYSATTLEDKITRRFYYGLSLGLCSLFVGISGGRLFLGFLQVGLAILASILFGVFNPLPAVYEEGLIALLATILVPFMV